MSKIQQAIGRIEKGRKAGADHQPDSVVGEVRETDLADDSKLNLDPDQTWDAEILVQPHRRVVHIDVMALRRAGLLAPQDDERLIVDEYRNIKRPLVAHAFGKRATKVPDGHLIMVGSALPGEGKTFSCINLALSMTTERDMSVLLVDADVAKPHITRLFGLEKEPGLLDILDRDVGLDVDQAILPTNLNGLSILPAGLPRAHATEMLASERMESLIRTLGDQDPNRIVLFDSPPLLMTSEAKVLASLVGQVVIIVHAGKTPQRAVFDAVGQVGEDKALNLVLNQVRHSRSGNYYGAYYGYGAGEGHGDAK